MVYPVEHACVLYGHYIPDIADHADGSMVPARGSANGTGFGIGKVMATVAMVDMLSEIDQGVAEVFHHLFFLSQKEKS